MRQNVIVPLALILLFGFGSVLSVSAQSGSERVIDSLFLIASSGEVRYQEAREPAMDSIATYAEVAMPFLIKRLNAVSRSEKWTALWIMERIGSRSVSFLVEALGSTEGKMVQRSAWALSRVGDSSAVAGLMSALGHGRWQVRDEALGALGKIGEAEANEMVLASLADSIGQVRKAAAVAAGKLRPDGCLPKLFELLADDFYGARFSAFEALAMMDSSALVTEFENWFPAADDLARRLGCQLLGRIGSDRAINLLYKLSAAADPKLRSTVGVAIIRSDPENLCGYHDRLFSSERDRLVLLKLKSALYAAQRE